MDSIALSEHDAAEVANGVYLAQLASGDRMSIQHFHIEPGATVPEHSHEHEQTGFVYSGALTFVVDGEEWIIEEQDSYAIPSDEPHAAENRTDRPVRGIDVFSPPRLDVPWSE